MKNNTDTKTVFEKIDKNYSYLLIRLMVIAISLIIIILSFYDSKNSIFTTNFLTAIFLTILLFITIVSYIIFYNKNSNLEEGDLDKLSYNYKNFVKFMIDYRPAINLIFGLTCIGTLFGILAMMGVFNSSPPKNNYELWLVYLLIFGLIATTLIVFAKSKESEDENLKFVPLKSKKFYEGLKKYTVLFIVYVIFVIGLYILNPFGIMTKYGGTTIFTTIWIGIVLIVLIGFYYYFFNNPNEKPEETFFSDSFIWYLTPIYIMFSFYISGLLIYGLLSSIGLFNQDVKSTNSVLSFIINIFFICLMLSIIYKLINLGGFLENSPIFKLIVNIIFYIPCLLVIIFNNIFNLIFKGTTLTAERRDYAYLLVAVILFTIYFFLNYIVPIIMKKYYKRGGKQLINNPVETEVLTNITTYQELSDSDKYDYRY